MPAINVPPMFDSTLIVQLNKHRHEVTKFRPSSSAQKLSLSFQTIRSNSFQSSSASVTFFWLVAEKIISASKKLKAKWLLAQPIFCAHGGVGSSNTSSGTKMSQENEDK